MISEIFFLKTVLIYYNQNEKLEMIEVVHVFVQDGFSDKMTKMK